MFSQVINTAFSSDYADEIFPHINGSAYESDRSFVGTARALITPHLPADFDGDIRIEYNSFVPVIDPETGAMMVEGFPDAEARDRITIINIPTLNDVVEDGRNRFLAYVMEAHPEFSYDEKTTVFFETSIKAMACFLFIDKEHHNSVIFVENFSSRKNHAIQSMLPRITPWWWDGTSPSPDERELLMSLCSRFPDKVQQSTPDGVKSSPGYTQLIKKYEPLYDFRGAKIRKYLPDFMRKCAEGELERVKMELVEIDNDIDGHESAIRSLTTRRHDTEIRFLGLKMKSEQEQDMSLADYFCGNPYVDLVSVDGTELTFCVYTTLEWWDDERAPYLVDNRESDMYSKTGGIRKDDYYKLLKAVFVDRTMLLRTCAAYRMSLSDGSMSGLRSYSNFADTTHVPNAHIQRHGCTGNYRQQFRDAIRHGDYVLAVDIAITSAKSLNFGDISFAEMMNDIGSFKDCQIFQDLDGNLYTAAEAVKKIKQDAKGGKK